MKFLSFLRGGLFQKMLFFCVFLFAFAFPLVSTKNEDHAFFEQSTEGPKDPEGFLYEEGTGYAYLVGGGISITPPPGGSTAYRIGNAPSTARYLYNNGYYGWAATGTPFVEGTYTMSITPPPGYSLSSTCLPQPGPFSTMTTGTVSIGQSVSSSGMILGGCAANPYYFSFAITSSTGVITNNHIPLQAPPLCTGTDVTGTMFVDVNRNGLFDVTETGVSSAVVEAYTTGGLLEACRTDTNGRFGFTAAPGTNLRLQTFNINGPVRESGTTVTGSYSNIVFVQSPASGLDTGWITSSYNGVSPQVGNRVWNDIDSDGIQDPGEPGISGVIVRMYTDTVNGPAELIGQATTTATGEYYFGGSGRQNLTVDLSPYANYDIVIPLNQTALVGVSTTLPNVGDDDIEDIDNALDSDATLGTGSFTTSVVRRLSPYPNDGRINFPQFDFGFTSTPAPMYPDLTITGFPFPTSTLPSSTIIFVYNYSNSGDALATGVTVSTSVPVGSIYSQSNSFGTAWSCSNGSVAGTPCTLNIGSVAVDGAGSFYFGLTSLGTYGGMVTATTDIVGTAPEINLSNNRSVLASFVFNSSTPTPPPPPPPPPTAPNLSITKSANLSSVFSGETVLFTLTYGNEGTAGATGVVITETVPTGAVYVAASSTVGWSCGDGSPAGTSCTNSIGTVGVDVTGTAAFAVQSLADYTGNVTNTATIDDDALNGADSDIANNIATAVVAVVAPPTPPPPPPPPPAPPTPPSPSPSPTPSPSPSSGGGISFRRELTGSIDVASCSPTAVIPVTLRSPEATEVRVGNESSLSDGVWQPITSELVIPDWIIPSVDGVYTIYARFRNNIGRISQDYSVNVVLDTAQGCNPNAVPTPPPVPSPAPVSPSLPTPPPPSPLPTPALTPRPLPPPTIRPPAPQPVAVRVSSTEPAVFTQVPGNICAFDCNTMTYDAYIVNPDGTERHMGGSNVRVVDFATDIQRVLFEDSDAIDKDYNDVVVEITKECVAERVKVEMLFLEALWKHQIHFKLFRNGVEENNFLLWPNSHTAIGDGKIIGGRDAGVCAPVSIEPVAPTSTLVSYSINAGLANGTVSNVFQRDGGELSIQSLSDDVVELTIKGEGLAEQGVYLIELVFNNNTYALAFDLDTNAYQTSFVMPSPGVYPGEIKTYYRSFTDTKPVRVESASRGLVQLPDSHNPVGDIRVALYSVDPITRQETVWNGAAYNQKNPMITGADGAYGFVVPNGEYRLALMNAAGVEEKTEIFTVEKNIVNEPLVFQSTGVMDGENTTEFPISSRGIFEGGFTIEALKAWVQQLATRLRVWANLPQVEAVTKNTVVPIAGIVPVLAVAPALSTNTIPFFYYFFFQPLLLLGQKRRKEWGVVYNSLTKLPIDLATVRLVSAVTKKIVQTRVTDMHGRYVFSAPPGEYYIQVVKSGFELTSAIPLEVVQDGAYVDLYHGEMVAIEEEGTPIAFPIPLDPMDVEKKTPVRIKKEQQIRVFQRVLSVSGLIVLLGSMLIQITPFTFIFIGVQLLAFALFVRLTKTKKPRAWGHVYNGTTDAAIPQVVARLFSSSYNKLIDTAITNRKGQYAFLVGASSYYVTFSHAEYEPKEVRGIDVKTETDQSAFVTKDVALTFLNNKK